jgi:type I restriction enzyme, R subunit
MTMDSFRFDEKYLSQIPALQVLVNLGYQYLMPAEALAARGGAAMGSDSISAR